MNRLVKALVAQPSAVELAVQRNTVPFDLLRELLGAALFSEVEWGSVAAEEATIERLRDGYLQVIPALAWDFALGLAEVVSSAGGTGWRTVMIPSADGQAGITVPQDSSDEELIALFTDLPLGLETIVYYPGQGSLVDLSAEHCRPPSWGVCSSGVCGGCKARIVWDSATQSKGIRCRCPEQAG
jgi:hypothetical protein